MTQARCRKARSSPRTLAAPLALLAVACGQEAPPPEPVVRPVKMLEIREGGQTVRREYPGAIRAAQNAEMAFEVSGKIVEFVYNEGDRVEQDAVLARIDPRDYQARFDAAKADYENARVNFERAQKLFEEGALAALQRDARRTRFQNADAALREAQKALEDTELRAPFSGVLARRLVDDFQNVMAKQPVLILQDDSSLEIKVNVPERDLARRTTARTRPEEATARLQPRVVVTSLPDVSFPARIKELATTADEVTRTYEVTLAFATPTQYRVLPGMTAKVVVQAPAEHSGRSAALRIPASATRTDESGEAFVWRIARDAMTAQRAPVKLGGLSGDQVAVLEGLEDGDLIAISGVHQLRDGMAVRRLGE
jgi:RND family efflux transporter MFP subunit